MHRTHITVLFLLCYKATSDVLELNIPLIDQFEMPKVNMKMFRDLREIIEAILKNSLPLVRIYKLEERDMNHSLAKSTLKTVHFEDHRIGLEFAFK